MVVTREVPDSLSHLLHAYDGWCLLDLHGIILWASPIALRYFNLENRDWSEPPLLIDCVATESKVLLARGMAKRDQTELFVQCDAGAVSLRLIPRENGWLVCASVSEHPGSHVVDERRTLLDLIRSRDATMRSVASRLHDDVGAQLVALRFEAELSQQGELPAGDDGLAAVFKKISNVVELVSAISRELHPATVEQLGLEEAVRYHTEVVAQISECAYTYSGTTVPIDLDPDLALVIYQIVCTAVTRSRLKESTWLKIEMLGTRTEVTIEIEHDGVAFDAMQLQDDHDKRFELECRFASFNGKLHFRTSDSTASLYLVTPRGKNDVR